MMTYIVFQAIDIENAAVTAIIGLNIYLSNFKMICTSATDYTE